MAHDRPDIAHVDLPHREIALPPHHVERIERVHHFRNLVLRLDADFPFAAIVQVRVRLGRRDHRRIVQRVLPEETLFRRVELRARLDNQKEIVGGLGRHPVRYRPRHHHVVALFETERTEIRFDNAGAAMHEDQLVAVRVAVVKRHRLGAPRHVQHHVLVSQHRRGRSFAVAQIRRFHAVQIEAVRPQLAFEPDPAGGRMRVIEVRALAVKSLAPVLFLVGAFRQAHMRLACEICLS